MSSASQRRRDLEAELADLQAASRQAFHKLKLIERDERINHLYVSRSDTAAARSFLTC